jgi:outer membrane protein OmpA-like peptidoglycan-associated protein
MCSYLTTLKFQAGCAVLAAALILPAGFAAAQHNPSAQQIIEALKPKPVGPAIGKTRSLSAAPRPEQAQQAETEKFVDSLRNRPTRSLSLDEREKIAAVAETRPRIDMEIKFDFNSSNISKSALGDIDNLGKALTDPALKGSTFALGGHTDGVGGEEYNLDLSSRRADAVKAYLISKYKMDPGHLITAGYGKTKLKNSSDPRAAENRRVQIVNMADK